MQVTYDKVLVTGGAGFIGSHTVDALLDKGAKVWVLDDFSTGSMGNLRRWKRARNLRISRGSVCNYRKLFLIARRSDAIIHLAAIVSPLLSLRKPELVNSVNVSGTLSVLRAGLTGRVGKIVCASSSSVYGNSSSRKISEDTALNPTTPYGASKLAAEKYCSAYHAAYGLSSVPLRYFNVYGERQSSSPYSGVIAIFTSRLLAGLAPTINGDGNQTRDFIHVSDVVRANLLALESRKASGMTLNIGTGQPTTIRKLATTLSMLTRKRNLSPLHAPARTGDIRKSCADISLASRLLGFHPRIGLEDGLRSVVEWFRERKDQTLLKEALADSTSRT